MIWLGDENVVKQTFFVVYEKLLTILLSFLFNYEQVNCAADYNNTNFHVLKKDKALVSW